ncbi:MAG: translation initiation factor IF-3 [Candidatus Pacebacteria bacterium]|nr:translation initiation factor IF-3 [Candidatus Paceibacterota bacterium]
MKKRYYKKKFNTRPLIRSNESIRAFKVRIIDEKGEQLGIMSREEALKMAKERGLDLIQVTKKVEPPVCKIANYGKYLYQQKKKDKSGKSKGGEMKRIRLTFGISDHDLETRAKQTGKFLNKGYKVMIEMNLRGRQKGSTDFAKTKMEVFLEKLKQEIPLKVERELVSQPRGLTMIISKSTKNEKDANAPPENTDETKNTDKNTQKSET